VVSGERLADELMRLVAGRWTKENCRMKRRKKGEDSYRLNMEVIRTYHIVYGCPPRGGRSDGERGKLT
jgi:hypothetical protein